MQKKLTITVDAEVYDGLVSVVGRRRISRFLSDLARPHVTGGQGLAAGYAAMAADAEREREAEEWAEGLVGDVAQIPPPGSAPAADGPSSAGTSSAGSRGRG